VRSPFRPLMTNLEPSPEPDWTAFTIPNGSSLPELGSSIDYAINNNLIPKFIYEEPVSFISISTYTSRKMMDEFIKRQEAKIWSALTGQDIVYHSPTGKVIPKRRAKRLSKEYVYMLTLRNSTTSVGVPRYFDILTVGHRLYEVRHFFKQCGYKQESCDVWRMRAGEPIGTAKLVNNWWEEDR
jgi:hypothetical protein